MKFLWLILGFVLGTILALSTVTSAKTSSIKAQHNLSATVFRTTASVIASPPISPSEVTYDPQVSMESLSTATGQVAKILKQEREDFRLLIHLDRNRVRAIVRYVLKKRPRPEVLFALCTPGGRVDECRKRLARYDKLALGLCVSVAKQTSARALCLQRTRNTRFDTEILLKCKDPQTMEYVMGCLKTAETKERILVKTENMFCYKAHTHRSHGFTSIIGGQVDRCKKIMAQKVFTSTWDFEQCRYKFNTSESLLEQRRQISTSINKCLEQQGQKIPAGLAKID